MLRRFQIRANYRFLYKFPSEKYKSQEGQMDGVSEENTTLFSNRIRAQVTTEEGFKVLRVFWKVFSR